MFRIECFVTDRHLPDVLRALGQRVMNLSVQPVVDAAIEKRAGAKGPREKIIKQTNGSSLEGFIRELVKAPAINSATAQAAAQASGAAPASYGYLLKKAIAAGIIRKKGKGPGTTYVWPKPPTLGREPKREK